MTLKFLLDTNIVSEPMKPSPNPGVMAQLKKHGDEIAIASVVWHELVFGIHRLPPSGRRTWMERYLDEVVRPTIPILPYDHLAAEWHGKARTSLQRQGRVPSFSDGQIAAIAKTHELVLVTRNKKDFSGFEGLKIQDWFK